MDYKAILDLSREKALDAARMMYPPGPRRLQYYEMKVAKEYMDRISPLPFCEVIRAPVDLMQKQSDFA